MKTYEGIPTSNPTPVTYTESEPEAEPEQGEFSRFAELTLRLLAVPKSELDEKLKGSR